MKTALHAYATDGKMNSGDFILGPSTKWHFQNSFTKEEIEWSEINIRNIFTPKQSEYVNEFDYFVIGGGGLMLPDSNSNEISCWQWPVSNESLRKITTPTYALSLGYNLFHGQKITMGGQSNTEDPKRYSIFKRSIETLIEVSTHFSLRHKGDCDRLKEIVDAKYHDKIKFEFCPCIAFCKHYIEKHNLRPEKRDLYAFEIKDDRPSRRYYNTSMEEFYGDLKSVIVHLLSIGKRVCVLSHDGSSSFRRYLDTCGIHVEFMNNACANEQQIISNYLSIDKLFCTAGHSQMMGHALGCDIVSLITHDKLKYYLEDTELYADNKHVDVNNENVYRKLMGVI